MQERPEIWKQICFKKRDHMYEMSLPKTKCILYDALFKSRCINICMCDVFKNSQKQVIA